MIHFERGDIEAFMGRGWDQAARLKEEFWSQRLDDLGPGEGVRVADELRRQVLIQHPDWPSAQDRQDDMLSHFRVAESLRRASARCR